MTETTSKDSSHHQQCGVNGEQVLHVSTVCQGVKSFLSPVIGREHSDVSNHAGECATKETAAHQSEQQGHRHAYARDLRSGCEKVAASSMPQPVAAATAVIIKITNASGLPQVSPKSKALAPIRMSHLRQSDHEGAGHLTHQHLARLDGGGHQAGQGAFLAFGEQGSCRPG